MKRTSLVGIIAGMASFCLITSVVWGAPIGFFASLIAPLPLFLAGLSSGVISAAIGTGVVAITLLLTANWLSTLVFILSSAIPVILVTYLALMRRRPKEAEVPEASEWYPADRILIALTGYACVLFLILYAGFLGHEGGLKTIATARFSDFIGGPAEADKILKAFGYPFSGEEYIAIMGEYWPIMACLTVIPLIAGNAGFAQRLLVRRGHNARPSPKVIDMALPEAYLLGLMAALILSLIGGELGYLGRALSIILWVPYFLLGLTVVHAISSAWPNRTVFLTLFYVAMILLLWVAQIVAFLGLLENWLKLRERFSGRDPNQMDP